MQNSKESDKIHGVPYFIKILHDYSESKLFLIFLTAYTYLICDLYFKAFCTRLSIPYIGLEFPKIFLIQSGYIVSWLIIFSILSILVISGLQYVILWLNTKFINCKLRGIIIIVIIIILIIIFFLASQYELYILSFFVVLIFVAFFKLKLPKYTDIIIIIFIFILYPLYQEIPEKMGDDLAKEMIEGSSNSVQQVDIQWDSSEPEMEKNKTLILIMNHNNKYYIVEKDRQLRDDEHAKLYIIPESKVKFVSSKI